MVLVKMLMEIDPLPMRGSMVMTMVTISPSRRDVSSVEQLCRSPRLVPPRFPLETASPKTPYTRRWASGACQVAHEAGGTPRGVGHAPTLVDGGWLPSGIFFTQYFLLIPKITSVEFQDFWSCAE